jgi:hypothetical protein
MQHKVILRYSDGSIRNLDLYDLNSNFRRPSKANVISFIWKQSTESPHPDTIVEYIHTSLLPRLNTNPILFAISINTCPESIRHLFVLPPEQLTFKGAIQ